MSNPYVKNFVDDLKSRYPTDSETMTYSDWVYANTKINGKPFGNKDYEFQTAIIDDMSRDLVCIKPSQTGLTETQVRKFLAFLTRNRGTSGIFTFPNEKMFKSNSKTRIKPIVKQPVFNSSGLDDTNPTRAVNLYEINGSWAHITGLTEGDATSTPADILFHDEVDLSDQSMLGLFQSRLQNSNYRITQQFSTPTHPGYGIDAAYQMSDMREYFLKCDACNHWQVPVFDMKFLCLPGYKGDGKLVDLDVDTHAAIDRENCYVKCEKCSARLDMRTPALREWVAERPGREVHGYRVRTFSTWKLDPAYVMSQLLKMKRLDNIRGWYNTVLGEPYSDGNSKLEPDVVKRVMISATRPDVGALVPCALAADMGLTCHLTLGVVQGEHVVPFLFEQVPSDIIEERITELRQQYNIVAGAVDRHPYTPTSEKIRDDSHGIILPVEYRGTDFINLKKDEYDRLDFVQVNRTHAIDNVVRAIQRQAWTMSGYGSLGPLLIEHLCDMVRIELPEQPATWQKLTGSDHFLHSLVLLQQSIKIRHIIQMTEVVPIKTLFGMVGVALPRKAPAGVADVRPKDYERLM